MLLRSTLTQCVRVRAPVARGLHASAWWPDLKAPAKKAQPSVSTDPYEDGQNVLMALNTAAVQLRDAGNLEQSQSLFQQLVDGRRESNGDRHPLTLYALGSLASVCRLRGDLPTAARLAREAASSAKEVLGDIHTDTLGLLTNLSAVLKDQGQLTEAEELGRNTLGRYRERLPEGCPDTLIALSNLAQVLLMQGKHAEAEPLLREDLRLSRRMLGREHPDTLVSLGNLGQLLFERGQRDEARKMLREQLSSSRRVLGDSHPHTLTSLSNLAYLLHSSGAPASCSSGSPCRMRVGSVGAGGLNLNRPPPLACAQVTMSRLSPCCARRSRPRPSRSARATPRLAPQWCAARRPLTSQAAANRTNLPPSPPPAVRGAAPAGTGAREARPLWRGSAAIPRAPRADPPAYRAAQQASRRRGGRRHWRRGER